jgi:hypothetical protein
MRFTARIGQLADVIGCVLRHPLWSARRLSRFPEAWRARRLIHDWPATAWPTAPPSSDASANTLRRLFDARVQGRGMFKWLHYFDAYQRHLQKFVGTHVHLVEVGVYSGGSLELWRDYLGPHARITGIDIMRECERYGGERICILIGDQGDRSFWRHARDTLPPIDVLIDDGGHTAEQQRVTLEETLPYLRPGGVYICEDVHNEGNRFASFVQSMADGLNAAPEVASPLQAQVLSVHLYPFLVVVERAAEPMPRLQAEKRGTEWASYSTRRRDIERATQGTT